MQYDGFGPGKCNCNFVDAYPFAVGPRLGVAYQITPKTVFRGGWGIVYGALVGMGNSTQVNGTGGWNTLNFVSPAYGEPTVLLRNGMQYDKSVLYGNTNNPGIMPAYVGQIGSPPSLYDKNAARPPRLNAVEPGNPAANHPQSDD